MPLIQRFPCNSKGRDFVIGDLHGCLPLLQQLLNHVQFDPALDRVFSTGDLIDRGPDSAGCLELLKQDWFHTVMGNHELMLIRYLESVSHDSQSDETLTALEHLLINGGDWILLYEKRAGQTLANWLLALKRLPMLINVGSAAAPDRFHVTHGDLLLQRGRMLSDDLIDALEKTEDSETNRLIFDGLPASVVMDRSVWSRRLFKHPGHYETMRYLKRLSLVYVGHTMIAKPRLLASHLFIDGGAFLAGRAEEQAGHGLNLIDHQRRIRYWTNGRELVASPLPELNP